MVRTDGQLGFAASSNPSSVVWGDSDDWSSNPLACGVTKAASAGVVGATIEIIAVGRLDKIIDSGCGFFITAEAHAIAIIRFAICVTAKPAGCRSFEKKLVEKVTEGNTAFVLAAVGVWFEHCHCLGSSTLTRCNGFL